MKVYKTLGDCNEGNKHLIQRAYPARILISVREKGEVEKLAGCRWNWKASIWG